MKSDGLVHVMNGIDSVKGSTVVATGVTSFSLAGVAAVIQPWVSIIGVMVGIVLSVVLIRRHALETKKLQIEINDLERRKGGERRKNENHS